MLQGADIIAYPAGGSIHELLPGWRTLVSARAIGNLVFMVACENLYGDGKDEGVGTIAGPEGVLANRKGRNCIQAELDFDCLAFLRGEDEKSNFLNDTLQFRHSAILRPELYAWLAAQNQNYVTLMAA